MGRFIYGSSHSKIEIEDRALTHLQHVIGNKLRRREGFFFTWREDVSVGGGRRTVWIHPEADLEFKYHGSRSPTLSRPWLEALTSAANAASGLYLVPEPAAQAGAGEEALTG
ncbi:DUF7882 family protein [Microbacterium thalli]|uniref:DUF7882 family protein n=1 Tax=Microbacterium thalli TaxID=3027921 RepID=UPI002365F089|nr:ATP-dependent DNA ligase [Microbacterium thalli]MDD7929911.1 ATP-dependent DNA ligase [Microbacterium thalli]